MKNKDILYKHREREREKDITLMQLKYKQPVELVYTPFILF